MRLFIGALLYAAALAIAGHVLLGAALANL